MSIIIHVFSGTARGKPMGQMPQTVKVKKVKFSPLQALEALRVVRG
jgi:hypothetical protein